MAKLKTDFRDGEYILADFLNNTNSEVNRQAQETVAKIEEAAQSASEASGYLADLKKVIGNIQSPNDVGAQVALNATDLLRTPYISIGTKTFRDF